MNRVIQSVQVGSRIVYIELEQVDERLFVGTFGKLGADEDASGNYVPTVFGKRQYIPADSLEDATWKAHHLAPYI